MIRSPGKAIFRGFFCIFASTHTIPPIVPPCACILSPPYAGFRQFRQSKKGNSVGNTVDKAKQMANRYVDPKIVVSTILSGLAIAAISVAAVTFGSGAVKKVGQAAGA